ncbi:MAG: dephospho-CoA kinase [Leptolyngbyaceae cyanobacterium bins.349]|nr:dephospho-CoA kinase [Leptolyngbyaceae cyanobacterium bins.349]
MTTNHRANVPQRIIGLTGGIAMGKTAVSSYLASRHHLPVLDADLYARAAVEPGTAVLAAIADRYGSGVLLANGQLNRQRLGEIVFNSAAERLWLEQCIHPYVRDRLVKESTTPPLNDANHCPILVMVIPLLFEARMTDLVTETWVVVCANECQIKRLMARDSISREQAIARINSQMTITKKMARADVVLENSTSLEDLFLQVDEFLLRQPDHVTSWQH